MLPPRALRTPRRRFPPRPTVPIVRQRNLRVGAASLLALMTAVVVIAVVFDSYLIPSEAMAPTLGRGDRILARHAADEVSRGDLVIYVAPLPGTGESTRVARVVAIAGDDVSADDGSLVINGRNVKEPYLRSSMHTAVPEPITVPRGHAYVLGDNRENSQDSRYFGPVPLHHITQRVSLRWWPIPKLGGL